MRGCRWVLLPILCLMVIGGILAQQSPSNVMVEAEIAYEAGDYAEAITLYEGLVADGYCDKTLFYNLGNAHYEAGQLGAALTNYHRAAQLAPRDAFISRAIVRVEGERIDLLLEDQHALVFIANSFSWFSMGELEAGLFMAWSVFFVALGGAVVMKARRGVFLRGAMLLGLVVVLLAGIYGVRWYVVNEMPGGAVTVPQAQVYSGPDESYIELYTLFDGAEIRLLEELDGGWVRFRLSDGRQGWIQGEAVTVYEPACS